MSNIIIRLYRCVATKIFDVQYSIQGYHEDYRDTKELEKHGTAATQCAHLIPESTYFRLSKDKKTAPVLAVLERFGYNIDSLNGPKIHSLHNVMSLIPSVHDFFDQLLWFEATIQHFSLSMSCAKVAHLSGAGEYIDRVQKYFDRLEVLAEDGGSSDVIFHALHHLAWVHVVEA
ncbi:MAG: hypothetical protein NXY57DRAFT_963689 [Lentinula lateritia]|uniref:HNH nuclease domain-containing protein n=1 Tax=Lentinula lateritia TaxID=40482 RepID=A0ABQ8VF44_9AGAR|nr:MAG: hypothetical protein NXY57DRAFT_963689 [Lentinula lateritia]KAJ4486414.1 hypothetical protein C8R41DRAFT_921286 [Lentinula lateritia]